MATTAEIIADFKVRFPEFDATIVDGRLSGLISAYPAYYGGDYDSGSEVILNLLAHLLYTSVNGSISDSLSENIAQPANIITSEEISSTSLKQTYSTSAVKNSVSAIKDYYGTTAYGQRFLMLTRNNIAGYFV